MHRLQPNVDTWHHGKVHRVSLRRHDYLFILFLFVTDIRTLRVWFRAKSVERNSKRNGHWQHMSLASIDRSMQLHTNQSQYIHQSQSEALINKLKHIYLNQAINIYYLFIYSLLCLFLLWHQNGFFCFVFGFVKIIFCPFQSSKMNDRTVRTNEGWIIQLKLNIIVN